MCYNLHHEDMRKMQREKTRDGVLSPKRSEGLQAVQKSTHGKNKPILYCPDKRNGNASLFTETKVCLQEVSVPISRHRVSVARPHQWQGRPHQKYTQATVPMDKEQRFSDRLSGALLQLQSRETKRQRVSSLVPQVAAEIFRVIKQIIDETR